MRAHAVLRRSRRARSRSTGRRRGSSEWSTATRWLEPSWCCRPSPASVVRPAVRAEQEAARARVGRRPDQVAHALEAEHRVVDVERQHRQAVRRVAGGRGDPRRERAGLGDALLQDLAVLRFAVVQQLVVVLGLVELARRRSRCRPGGTASAMPKVRASSATIGTMRGPSVSVLQQLREQRTNAIVVDISLPLGLQRELREVAASGGTAALGALRAPAGSRRAPRAARAGTASPGCRRAGLKKRSCATSLVRERQREAVAEFEQRVVVELLLLVRAPSGPGPRCPCRSPSWSAPGSRSAGPCGAPRRGRRRGSSPGRGRRGAGGRCRRRDSARRAAAAPGTC